MSQTWRKKNSAKRRIVPLMTILYRFDWNTNCSDGVATATPSFAPLGSGREHFGLESVPLAHIPNPFFPLCCSVWRSAIPVIVS